MIGVIDVGGTKLLTAGAEGGRIGATVRRPTPDQHPIETLVAMLDEVRHGTPLEAIAMSVPGPFDRDQAALTNPPNLPAIWHCLALRDHLGEHYGCPVVVENDANCAALAEATAGAAAGLRTVVYFTVSTGIGTGVVRDGQLLIARHDSEGGHQVLWPKWLGGPACLCGGAGCLEALASGSALERRFHRRAEAIEDPAIWEEVGRWLGLAVVNTTALHDPDAVVFGGGVCAAWERFAPSLEATVTAALHVLEPPRVLLATLGERSTLMGALALVRPPGRH